MIEFEIESDDDDDIHPWLSTGQLDVATLTADSDNYCCSPCVVAVAGDVTMLSTDTPAIINSKYFLTPNISRVLLSHKIIVWLLVCGLDES